MATVTMFFDYEHYFAPSQYALYQASTSYADVDQTIADIIVARGLGEIVPDEIMAGPTADEEAQPLELKPTRRKVSKKWQ